MLNKIAYFGTELEAIDYVDQCNNIEGLPKPGVPEAEYPYGWTLNWADIREIAGKWPIMAHPSVPVPEGVEVIAEEPIL